MSVTNPTPKTLHQEAATDKRKAVVSFFNSNKYQPGIMNFQLFAINGVDDEIETKTKEKAKNRKNKRKTDCKPPHCRRKTLAKLQFQP